MRRFFVKNILFVVAVNLLVKPLWIFLIDRTVQNRVGHETYGTYQALFNLALIFQILLDFGLTNYNTRTIAQQPEKLPQLFPAMLSTRLLFFVGYGIVVGLVAWLIGYTPAELTLLGGILAIQGLNTLMQFLRSNVAALHRFRLDGLLSVTDRFLMIVLCSVLLFHPAFSGGFTIGWFVLAQVVCYGLAVVIGYVLLRSITKLPFRFTIHLPTVLGIIKESLPYALLIFLMYLYSRSDTLLIERLCGPAGKEEAGRYAAAYRLLDVSNMFALMFASILLPLFGRMLAQKQDVMPIIRLSVNLLLPVAFIGTAIAIFWGAPIMQLLYNEARPEDGVVFAWLMACFPSYCIMYVYSTLLTANGNLNLLNKQALAGVFINLALNLYLIPRYYALGAGIASFITQALMALGFIFLSGRALQVRVDNRWTLTHLLFLGSVLLAAYAATLLPVNWMLQLSILTVCGLLLMLVFRFLSVRAVRELLRYKKP